MAIDPNEDLKQAEAILNGKMDERNATPAARQLALRIKNQPLTYPNKPKSMGGGPRPRGPLPRQTSSLSGGMVGAPSEPMSPDESMLVGDQRDAAIISKSLRDNGYTTDDANDPRFAAEGRMSNRRENPSTQGDEAELDAQISRENRNAGQTSPSDRPGTIGQNDPNIAMGQITDENRQNQRNWNQFANASPGSEVQARYNPSGYAAYENRVTQNRQLANERERYARQQELNLRSPEEHEAILEAGRQSAQTRKDNIRNNEVMRRTGLTAADVAAMKTPAEKEKAMSEARAMDARAREESYRRQARLGGGTVSGRTARADEVLQGMTPDARSRTLAQVFGGGAMGANDVEAQEGANLIRGLLSGGVGQGGAANGVLAQAQAAGANQQNAQNAQALRRKDEDQIIGDQYAPGGGMFGHDAFTLDEQNQAVADLRARGYTEQQALDAVRRIKRERTGILGQPGI